MLVADKYDDFVSNETSVKYISANKQFRQVLFGNLARKRIQKFQEVLMQYLHSIYTNTSFDIRVHSHSSKDFQNNVKEIYLPTSDELIFHFDKSGVIGADAFDAIEHFISESSAFEQVYLQSPVIADNFFEFRKTCFKLEQVKTNKGNFYVKRFEGKGNLFEIKACPSKFQLQFHKILKGKRIRGKDLIFEDKETKSMCKFLKSDKLRILKK